MTKRAKDVTAGERLVVSACRLVDGELVQSDLALEVTKVRLNRPRRSRTFVATGRSVHEGRYREGMSAGSVTLTTADGQTWRYGLEDPVKVEGGSR